MLLSFSDEHRVNKFIYRYLNIYLTNQSVNYYRAVGAGRFTLSN